MNIRLFFVVLLLVLVGGCSLLNREGPDVTCNDLSNGSACEDGIIATCVGGTVRFRVCSDKNACSSDWQVPGKHRCSTDEKMPSSETGGEAGGGNGTAGNGAGGSENGPMVLGSTGGLKIDAYAVTESAVYFSDCSTLWTVPKDGGATKQLAKLSGCAFGGIAADTNPVYLLESANGSSGIVRVSEAAGTREAFVTAASNILAMAADSDSVYWAESGDFSINRRAKTGGAPILMTTTDLTGTRLIASQGYLYWMRGQELMRMKSNVESSQDASTVGSLPELCNDFAVDGTNAFFTLQSKIWILPLSGGVGASLVDESYAPSMITTSGNDVIWEGANGTIIQSVSKQGGASKVVSKAIVSNLGSLGRIVAKDGIVYWAEENKMMKVRQ